MYKAFSNKGYKVLHTAKDLAAANPKDKTLGIFCSKCYLQALDLLNGAILMVM